jgi:hypothetical protein
MRVNIFFHSQRRTWLEGISEQSVEKNMWTYDCSYLRGAIAQGVPNTATITDLFASLF